MLNFGTASGYIFPRLGAIFNAIKQNIAYQGTTLPAIQTDVNAQLVANQGYIPTFQTTITSGQNAASAFSSAMSAVAQNVLIQMVMADTPQPAATLAYCLPELITQMQTATASVVHNTITVSSSASTSNGGNGTLIIATTNTSTPALILENVLPEVFTITCVSDSQPGNGATAGQEGFTAQGDVSYTNLSWQWPGGTGGQANITSASADVQASSANVLTNSNFETWTGSGTAGSLTGWAPLVGAFGVDINQTSGSYRGSYAVALSSTGSELTGIYQTLASPTIAGIIQPQTKYALAVRTKVSATPSAGVLRVSLKDTSAGTVYAASTITLSGETTAYALHSTTFNTPLSMPANWTAVVELTTAIDAGKSVFVDDFVITQMTQYQNGLYLSIIPGNANFVRGDVYTVTVTNDLAGQFQTWFNRCFNMSQAGLLLPSAASASATIPNSLIT